MPDTKSDELIQVEELILEEKIEEALNLVRRIEGKAWMHYSKGDYEEALSLAFLFKKYHKISIKQYFYSIFFYIFIGLKTQNIK